MYGNPLHKFGGNLCTIHGVMVMFLLFGHLLSPGFGQSISYSTANSTGKNTKLLALHRKSYLLQPQLFGGSSALIRHCSGDLFSTCTCGSATRHLHIWSIEVGNNVLLHKDYSILRGDGCRYLTGIRGVRACHAGPLVDTQVYIHANRLEEDVLSDPEQQQLAASSWSRVNHQQARPVTMGYSIFPS